MKNKNVRENISATIHPRIVELLREYQNDTFQKSRSQAIEEILIEYFHDNGYIDYYTYIDLLGLSNNFTEREE